MDCARHGLPVLFTLIWLMLLMLTCIMPWESLGDGYSGAIPKGPPGGIRYKIELFKGASLNVPVANVESASLIDAFTCHVRMASQTYALFDSGTCAMFDTLRALLLLSMLTGLLSVVLPIVLGFSPLTTGLFIATWIGAGAVGVINLGVGAFSKTKWPVMNDLDFTGQPQKFDGLVWAILTIILTCGPLLVLLLRPCFVMAMGGGYTKMTN